MSSPLASGPSSSSAPTHVQLDLSPSTGKKEVTIKDGNIQLPDGRVFKITSLKLENNPSDIKEAGLGSEQKLLRQTAENVAKVMNEMLKKDENVFSGHKKITLKFNADEVSISFGSNDYALKTNDHSGLGEGIIKMNQLATQYFQTIAQKEQAEDKEKGEVKPAAQRNPAVDFAADPARPLLPGDGFLAPSSNSLSAPSSITGAAPSQETVQPAAPSQETAQPAAPSSETITAFSSQPQTANSLTKTPARNTQTAPETAVIPRENVN